MRTFSPNTEPRFSLVITTELDEKKSFSSNSNWEIFFRISEVSIAKISRQHGSLDFKYIYIFFVCLFVCLFGFFVFCFFFLF